VSGSVFTALKPDCSITEVRFEKLPARNCAGAFLLLPLLGENRELVNAPIRDLVKCKQKSVDSWRRVELQGEFAT
jgi:hypothetical protein